MTATKGQFILWYRNGYYKLYRDGRIEKPDGYISDGKSWEWLGLCMKKPFGNVGPIIPRQQCFSIIDLKYKNGKYRFVVADKDHGTTRLWGQ